MGRLRSQVWLILVVALVLVGCAASAGTVDNVVNYLDAINRDDLAAAEQYVCPAKIPELAQGLEDVPRTGENSHTFENIQCEAQGTDVACTYTLVQQMQDGTTQQSDWQVVYQIQQGKICGFAHATDG
jgi:PBP1b-binding outer membrane lipoprotein LpoB